MSVRDLKEKVNILVYFFSSEKSLIYYLFYYYLFWNEKILVAFQSFFLIRSYNFVIGIMTSII